MQTKVVLLLILSVLTEFVYSQSQTPVYLSQTITNANCKGFYCYLPAGYSTSNKNYPLIIWLHGAGQVGQGNVTDLPKILQWGVPKIISEGGFPQSFTAGDSSFSFIILSPQFIAVPTGNNVSAILDYASINYRVNPDRIYLMGISSGGAAVWDYASTSVANSNRVAAIIPFCGNFFPSQTLANRIGASNLPVWAFHNTNDGTVPVSYSRNWINYINSYVPTPTPLAILTEFPVMSSDPVIAHECWSLATLPTYKPNGINIYEWLLTYKKRTVSVNIPPVSKAGNDASVIFPANLTLSGSASYDPDGRIVSYRWKKISGPSSYNFSDSTIVNPVVQNLSIGFYSFELAVTDNNGGIGKDTVTITVKVGANLPPAANAGADIAIQLPVNRVLLDGRASYDSDGTINLYQWTFVSGPPGSQLLTFAKDTCSVILINSGTYNFRLTLTDNDGFTATDDVLVIVQPALSGSKAIRVNLYDGSVPFNNPQWNNWIPASNVNSASFKYDDGTQSTVFVNLSSHPKFSDNGANYAMAATVCPPAVLRFNSMHTISRILAVNGLSHSKQYRFEFYGSRGFVSGSKSIFRTGNVADTINTDFNINDFALLNYIIPDNNGKVMFTLSFTGTYNYLAGFSIIESSLPIVYRSPNLHDH